MALRYSEGFESPVRQANTSGDLLGQGSGGVNWTAPKVAAIQSNQEVHGGAWSGRFTNADPGSTLVASRLSCQSGESLTVDLWQRRTTGTGPPDRNCSLFFTWLSDVQPDASGDLLGGGGFENGTLSGFVAKANTTLSNSTAQAFAGTRSLALKATAAGAISASKTFSAVAGTTYMMTMKARAATVAAQTFSQINWFNSTGGYLSTANGVFINNSTTAWTDLDARFVAPTGAASGELICGAQTSPAANDIHYFDNMTVSVIGSTKATSANSVISAVWTEVTHTAKVPAGITGYELNLAVPASQPADFVFLDDVTVNDSTAEVVPPPPSGARTYRQECSESFAKPDGVGLGPDLLWTQTTNAANGNIHTKGQQASSDPAATSPFVTRARAEFNLSGTDHWAQMIVRANSLDTLTYRVASVATRWVHDGSATGVAGGNTGVSYALRLNCRADRAPILTLARINSTGTTVTLAGPVSVNGFPMTVRLEAVGTVLTCLINETVIFTYDDAGSADVNVTALRSGVHMQDMADQLFLDNFSAGTFGTQGLIFTASLRPQAAIARQASVLPRVGSLRLDGAAVTQRVVSRLAAGSLTPAGVLVSLQRLKRVLDGSLRPTGALGAVRTTITTLTASLRVTGTQVKMANARNKGTVTTRSAIARAAKKSLGATFAVAGSTLPVSLGRVFGRSGIVAMTVRAAGELRLRIRRPF